MKNRKIRKLVAAALAALLACPALGADGVWNPKSYGAKADGKADDTAAIQAAIDGAAKSGGGIVRLCSGTFLSGTIYLKSNISLEILPGAKLKGTTDKSRYNADDFCPQNRAIEKEHASGAHLIVALEVENVSISGGGEIDGGGLDFWLQVPKNAGVKFPQKFAYPKWRPGQMLFFCESKNISVRGVKLLNAPFWTCFFHGCSDVFVSGVKIKNDPRGHNNDGIDIDACSGVVVSDCIIATEDDSITLRGNPARLKNPGAVCRDVAISNCVLQSTCNGIRIGVGAGKIERCIISNILIKDTFQGISFVSAYHGNGGAKIKDLRLSNISIRASRALNMITDSFNWGKSGGAGYIRDIAFSDCSFGGNRTSIIAGHLEKNISGISFRNCDFELIGSPQKPKDCVPVNEMKDWKQNGGTADAAMLIRHAQNISFDGCRLKQPAGKPAWGKALDAENAANLRAAPAL
ncbi:MAG: hypothetical protein IJI37_04960 [Opitutales bacterium]|nr:hypothetical protein [Opitutales bacterium]